MRKKKARSWANCWLQIRRAKKSENSKEPAQQDTLKALRAMKPEELLKAAETETVRTIVDGWVLPQDVATIFAQGKQNDVPLIVGYNADEGTTLAPQGANMTGRYVCWRRASALWTAGGCVC